MNLITLFVLVVLAASFVLDFLTSAAVSVNAADRQLRPRGNSKFIDLTNDVDAPTMDRIKARYLNTVAKASSSTVQDKAVERRAADELSSMKSTGT